MKKNDEDILQQIPPGLDDWHKFIKPQELTYKMENNGLNNVVIRTYP
jgi:2-polyprenyl-6-hydroxyphenyl methylase / 3-demethylubiquinone-9 3-methyltransferase